MVAIFTPKPEFYSDVRALLFEVTPKVHDEPGCEFYTMNEDVQGRLVHIEAWTTKQHWLDHMQQQTVIDILKGVDGKLSKDIEVFELYNVPTGTSGKGTISST